MARPSVTVAAGAVDVQSDRPVAVSGQLAKPFDAGARRILLDVADQIHVPQPLARLLAQLHANGVDQLGDQTIAQLSHQDNYRIDPELNELGGTK